MYIYFYHFSNDYRGTIKMSNLYGDYSNLGLHKTKKKNLLKKGETTVSIMDKKIKVLVVGEVGYYSLFAEGYLRFYSAQKLKIKTTAIAKLSVNKKVARILEEDMIPSKIKLIPLDEASKIDADFLLHIGELPADLPLKSKKSNLHTIKVKKGLSLEETRDTIKKKILKFLDKQGLYAA